MKANAKLRREFAVVIVERPKSSRPRLATSDIKATHASVVDVPHVELHESVARSFATGFNEREQSNPAGYWAVVRDHAWLLASPVEFPATSAAAKLLLASRLTAAGGGQLKVEFSSGTCMTEEDEPGRRNPGHGHFFYATFGKLPDTDEFDPTDCVRFVIDDRKGDVAEQIRRAIGEFGLACLAASRAGVKADAPRVQGGAA
jgi:hypothetical protein